MTRIETATLAGVAAALLATAAMTASAQEKEYKIDAMFCYAGSVDTLTTSKEASAGAYQSAGIIRGTAPGGDPIDGGAFECVAVYDVVAGVVESSDRCVIVDRDGDRIWGRGRRSTGGNSYEFTGGSGKYAGATGVIDRKPVNARTPARAGTFQGCAHSVGSLRLK